MMALNINRSDPGCEAVTDTELNVDLVHLEIGDRVQLLALLLQRQEIADPAEIGIIFETDKPVLAEIARQPRRRCEIGFVGRAEDDVHDWIDDKLPLLVANADDGADFHVPGRQRELRHLIAELEIDAVKEVAFGGVRDHEQIADLGAVGKEFAGAGDCEWQIEADLPPFGQSVGKFRRACRLWFDVKPPGNSGTVCPTAA